MNLKTSLLARLGVATTIAAVALVGTTVPAQADTASIQLTKIALKPTATYKATNNDLLGTVTIVSDDQVEIQGAKTDVKVNGKTVATGVTLYSDGIYYQRAWGAGVVQLANVTVSGTDGGNPFTDLPLATPANSVRVKYALDPSSIIRYKRVGKRLTFAATVNYRNAASKLVSAGRATIQYKKDGKWRVLKTLTLNSQGKATYQISLRTKRYYRMVVAPTALVEGGSTKASRI